MKPVSYKIAMQEASALLSDGTNPEYDRGMVELLAYMFPKKEVHSADRACELMQILRGSNDA